MNYLIIGILAFFLAPFVINLILDAIVFIACFPIRVSIYYHKYRTYRARKRLAKLNE